MRLGEVRFGFDVRSGGGWRVLGGHGYNGTCVGDDMATSAHTHIHM